MWLTFNRNNKLKKTVYTYKQSFLILFSKKIYFNSTFLTSTFPLFSLSFKKYILDSNPEISADLIDLRTLQPLDKTAIIESVKKTGKAIILQEDSMFGGIASDISSMLMEECFEYLDAPVKRVASLETPIPFAAQLEQQYLPKDRFEIALKSLLAY